MNEISYMLLYVARCLLDGKMTIGEAAEVLSLSERQVKRIKKGVKEQGEAFVIHKNRGRKPSRTLTDEIQSLVINHKKSDKYSKANFSHFQELLEEHESICLSKPSVYRILVSHGFISGDNFISSKPCLKLNPELFFGGCSFTLDIWATISQRGMIANESPCLSLSPLADQKHSLGQPHLVSLKEGDIFIEH